MFFTNYPFHEFPSVERGAPGARGARTQGGERIRNHGSSFPPSAPFRFNPACLLSGSDVVS